ncbi:hypothetical protein [Oceanobacillus rekensis]|uniref:hypothetical protein n=1 Tax=Oceanobacillus rekensis TaxID=937927 RepID=UPI000B446C70|nr:hypothetical protein [Oceanobacillus rekensis]
MESAKDLKDFERKLITIIQHHNKRGRSPSLEELELRAGRDTNEIKEVIKDLIKREWLAIREGELVVSNYFSRERMS